MGNKKGTARGIRSKLAALEPPLPRDEAERKAERKRRKQLSKGPELSTEDLQRRLGNRTRIVLSGKHQDGRGRQKRQAIQEQQ